MSMCASDLCPLVLAEEDLEGDLEALAHWRDCDVDELDAHNDLQLLAQLRAGDVAANDPPPCPASGRSAGASTARARP